jgi:hypothetical protein
MPPYRNPVEARRKKDRPVQKVADENCYMSSADFNEKHRNAHQGDLPNGHLPARPVRKRQTSGTAPDTKRS